MNLNATLIIEILSFLILLVILIKLLFRPLLNIMDKRRAHIEKSINEAENSRAAADARLNEANEMLEKTRKGILAMKESSRLEAERAQKGIIEDARKEALRIMEDSKIEMDKEAKMVKKRLGDEIIGFVTSVAEKILKREIDIKDHQRLINDSIEEFTPLEIEEDNG